MTCPTCNGPLAHLFTSSYCPACEKREAESQVRHYSLTVETWTLAPAAVGTMHVVSSADDDSQIWMMSTDGWVPVVMRHPSYTGTFVMMPLELDKDGE